MDKINQLLNENTIVDVRFLWKLILRYRSHFFIAAVLFCAIFSNNYYSQPIIYSVDVQLKTVSTHTVATDLSALLPVANSSAVNLTELKSSMESYSFLKTFAEMVMATPEFEKLNFGSINANKSLYGRDLLKKCGKIKDCLVDNLVSNLRESFNVEQGQTEDRFNLTINSIEKKTVQVLSSVLVKAIDMNRVHVRQYLVLKEIQSVGNLIAESRSVLQKMDGYKALEDQEKLQNNIADLKERIRMLQYSISVETANMSSLESRLVENKRTTASKSIPTQEDYEKIQKNQAKLVELKQNITILTNIPLESRSASDNMVIAQLKAEKARLQKELPPEPHRKKLELAETFIEGQRGKAGDYEFDYQVAKSKLEKLNDEYEVSKISLNEMLQQKITNENKVISMKTDLDFLKNLEAKQMSLKLVSATMTSDIVFEDNNANAKEFRRSTYLKIFLFSFFMTGFIYLLSVLIRYLMDDRIYGEEEIRSHFKTLDFIGEAPSFE